MKTKGFKYVVCLYLTLLLTACGFHLRGVAEFPPSLNPMCVTYSEPNEPFVLALRQTLSLSGMALVKEPKQARVILNITHMDRSSHVQMSSTTGQVSTYVLQLAVQFNLENNKGTILLKNQAVQSSGAYTINSSQVLADSAQKQGLMRELTRNTINQIMARLGALDTRVALTKETEAS